MSTLKPSIIVSALLWLFALSATAPVWSQEEDESELEETIQPDYEEALDLYRVGKYREVIDLCQLGSEFDTWNPTWNTLGAQAMLQLGRYDDAFALLAPTSERFPHNLRLTLLLREAALHAGREVYAQSLLDQLARQINQGAQRFRYDPRNIVALGDAALLLGVDPRIVLENLYKRVQEEPSPPLESFLSSARLATDKGDYALASRTLFAGLEAFPNEPDLLAALARSFREDDRSQLLEYTGQAIAINPWHIESRLLIAEHLIDAEAYHEAMDQLELALAVNPRHPEALALLAAAHFLDKDPEAGQAARADALASWTSNPWVDHIIGRKLSQKYRFEDGAKAQTDALRRDPDFNPARVQLAQDLLRMGIEDEGWRMARLAHQSDPYDIAAYNLTVLHDKLDGFVVLESENFILRLSEAEAPVYGERALRVLERAHDVLTERYAVALPRKTIVEIYPEPADFEIRTFGMPGNPGFLGVCFGPVFTINSPATRSANWEAVLYHEFCHTVTLHLTNNRMPRWLSEGISVYEETLANPSWGQRMSAAHRDRILSGRMLPISEMSGAFLSPSEDDGLQFAYFQSYLVVEFLFQRFGLDAVKSVLSDLADDIETNDSLASRLMPIEELDEAFEAYARAKAAAMAAGFAFGPSELEIAPSQTPAALSEPRYDQIVQESIALLQQDAAEDAIELLKPLVEEAGYVAGPLNAHLPLAQAYRKLGDTENERCLLEIVCRHETHQLEPVSRLLDIAQADGDIQAQLAWSDAWIAINPMGETAWRAHLRSAAALEQPTAAIEAGRALVALDPPDRSSILFELAKQFTATTDFAQAKRHALMALEEAPRFRQAHELLASILAIAAETEPSATEESVPAENQTETTPFDIFDGLQLLP